MKPRKHPLPNLRIAALMMTSFVLIAAVFIFFSVKIDRQIKNNIHERIEEYAAQQKTYISTVLESRYAMLNAFSTYFGERLLTDTPEFGRLAKTLLVAGDFDHVLTIAKDGSFRVNTGETGTGDNQDGRELLLSRAQSISRPFRAFYDNDELCVLFSVPLADQEGSSAGMLCASYSAQRFGRLLLQDNYRDSAFSLLTDSKGNLLFSSSNQDIFVPDSTSDEDKRIVPSPTFFDEASSEKIRASMARREHNLYQIAHNGIDYVLVQTPIEQNNWMLFCMIPTDSLGEDYAFITQLRHIQLICIVAILTIISLILILMLLREWHRLSRENTVLAVRANTDSMTGLLNQGTTSATISEALIRHEGEGVLLLLDLDNLKGINDTLGHPIGDRAILLLSELLQSIFSSASVIGRIGGDEFMVYMSCPGSREDVRRQIQALQRQMHTTMRAQMQLNEEFPLHCSVGAAYAKPGDDYNSLYSRADIALYHVKHHGKDGYSFFEDIA